MNRVARNYLKSSAVAASLAHDEVVWLVPDCDDQGWGFETPDGTGYGAPSLDEARILAESLGFTARVSS